MRRKWREAMPKGATKENFKAAIGYDYCSRLFFSEKKYAGLSDAVRKTARQVVVGWEDSCLRLIVGEWKHRSQSPGANWWKRLPISGTRSRICVYSFTTVKSIFPTTLRRTLSGHLHLAEKNGRSVIRQQVQIPVRLSIRWWKPQWPTALSPTRICFKYRRNYPVSGKIPARRT